MKRKISLMMAAACLFSSMTFASAADEAKKTETTATTATTATAAEDAATEKTTGGFTDVTATTKYSDAIITLSKLGVINGYDNGDKTYSFKPDGEITRAEFTKIITVVLGAADTAVGSQTDFVDIDTHWAKNNIIIAAGRGIVNGFEDSTFRPDEKVTYEQAVKMIVCAAGYEPAAVALGGWPNGYLAEANTLKITKDANSSNQSAPATRGIVAQLIYNTLEVDYPVYNSVTGKTEYEETFMENFMGLVREKVKILGVEDKVVSGYDKALLEGEMAVRTKKNDVIINYTTFTTDKMKLEELVGMEAVVFFREGKSGELATLIELDTETVKNTVTTIVSADIDSYSSGSIKYFADNGKTKSLSIVDDATVYYNGKIVDNYDSSLSGWLDPADVDFIYGEVRLTDSGSDNTYDVIEITDYEVMVAAKTPSSSDYVVTNKIKFKNSALQPAGYLSQIKLDPGDINYKITITNASGSVVQATSIKANDVLLIAQSVDGEIINIKISSKPVSGKVTGYSSDDDALKIASKEYKVSEYAKNYFEDNNGISNISSLVDKTVTFYLDAYETIVYGTFSTTENNYPYAYLIKASKNDEEDGGTIQAYIPSVNGVKTYTVPSKVRLNGTSMSGYEAIMQLQASKVLQEVGLVDDPDYVISDSGANATQIIRLAVSGSEVEEIITSAAYSSTNNTTDDSSALIPYCELTGNTKYTGSNNFDGKFYINSSTTIIYVPGQRSESSSYGKKTVSSFSTTDKDGYLVYPYNVNSSKVANLVLLFGTTGSTTEATGHLWIAANESQIAYESDEEIYNIDVFPSTTTKTTKKAFMDNKRSSAASIVDVGDLTYGDIFRAGTNSSSKLVNATRIFSYDAVMTAISNGADFTASDFSWTSGSSMSAYVYNVIEVMDDNSKYSLRVTQNAISDDASSEVTGETIFNVESDTIIFRVDTDNEEVTPYVDGSDSEKISIDSLKEAAYSGSECSKIAVYMFGSTVATQKCKFILIYE